MEQYIYTLKLIPKLIDEKAWTERENQIVDRHFQYLQQLLQNGTLILAGRPLIITDEKTFGIVLFLSDGEESARIMMNQDPAVKEGVMTAELFPYRVALFNNDFQWR